MKKLLLTLIALALLLPALLTHAAPSEAPWLSDPYYLKRIKDINTWPARPGEILFIGDSITEGCDWKAVLQREDVWNYGIGGDKTFGVTNRMSMFTAVKPRKFFLLIGINDIRSGWTIDETAANYRIMLRTFKKALPKCEIYVQSVLPMDFNRQKNDFVKNNTQIVLLNYKIQALAKEFKYTYLDLFPDMTDQNGMLIPGYSDDGLHLNTTGHTAWAKLLKAYL